MGTPAGDTLPRRPSIEVGREVVPCLTLLLHADLTRVGERALLGDPVKVQMSRTELDFAPPRHATGRPLDDPYLSRRPITIGWSPRDGVVLEAEPSIELVVDGAAVPGSITIAPARLPAGVALELEPAQRYCSAMDALAAGDHAKAAARLNQKTPTERAAAERAAAAAARAAAIRPEDARLNASGPPAKHPVVGQ